MPRMNFVKAARRLALAVLPATAFACDSATAPAPATPPVASVEVPNAPASMDIGQTVQLVGRVFDATGAPVDRPVAWSTADTAIATVSEYGMLRARSAGTARITASAGGRDTVVLVEVRHRPAALTALSPSTTAAGTAGLELKVSGTGFAPDAVVMWNGDPRVTRVISATEVRADITAADLAGVGLADVTVSNPPHAAARQSNRLYVTIEPAPEPEPPAAGVIFDLAGLADGTGVPVEVERTTRLINGEMRSVIRRVVGGTLRTIPDENGTRFEIALVTGYYAEATGEELSRDTLYWWGTLWYDLWTGHPILRVDTPVMYNLQTELRANGSEWIVQQVVHTTGSPQYTRAWKYVKR